MSMKTLPARRFRQKILQVPLGGSRFSVSPLLSAAAQLHQLRGVSRVQHIAHTAGDHAQCQHGHDQADQKPEGLLIPLLH